MAAEKPIRITIGFQGGGGLPVRVAPADLKKMLDALRAGGWHELETDDGSVLIDLGQVNYVRTEAGDQRIGF